MPAFDCPVHGRLRQRGQAMLMTDADCAASTPPATAPAAMTRRPGANGPDDRAFANLLSAFCRHGGLLNGNEVAERLHRKNGSDLSSLARRIVARELICFEWQGELWLPLLQFDPVDMSLQPGLTQVTAELAAVFDAWELCWWLAAPNSSLEERAPLDVLEHDADAVLQVARLDRFVACG
jgi:hypothetical protein